MIYDIFMCRLAQNMDAGDFILFPYSSFNCFQSSAEPRAGATFHFLKL